MDYEIDSDRMPRQNGQMKMWRSIGLWLERPISQFVDKYAVDGAIDDSLAFGLQMDLAYAYLLEVPSFAAMLAQFPQIEDVRVVFADFEKNKLKANGLYNKRTREIALDTSESQSHPEYEYVPHFVSTGAHEYRHAFQHCVRDLRAHTKANYGRPHILTLSGFIDEADANAFQCSVAYELYTLCGVDLAWNQYRRSKPDIVSQFLAQIERDKASLLDGRAQHAAFLAFFQSRSSLNFYADFYMDELEGRLQEDPRALAESIWRNKKAKAHLKTPVTKGLPSPGQVFKKASASPLSSLDEDKMRKDAGTMAFAHDGVMHPRPFYGQDDLFPATSLDYYLQRLGDQQYARINMMGERLRDFDVQVSVELAKLQDKYKDFTPL